MDQTYLKDLLQGVQAGSIALDHALETLKNFPAQSMEDACLDHQRSLRTGIPEVIYGESKSADQVIAIAQAMMEQPSPVLATRITPEKANHITQKLPEFEYHRQARLLRFRQKPIDYDRVRGDILVICAGTSDLGIAEEARITAETGGEIDTSSSVAYQSPTFNPRQDRRTKSGHVTCRRAAQDRVCWNEVVGLTPPRSCKLPWPFLFEGGCIRFEDSLVPFMGSEDEGNVGGRENGNF